MYSHENIEKTVKVEQMDNSVLGKIVRTEKSKIRNSMQFLKWKTKLEEEQISGIDLVLLKGYNLRFVKLLIGHQ